MNYYKTCNLCGKFSATEKFDDEHWYCFILIKRGCYNCPICNGTGVHNPTHSSNHRPPCGRCMGLGYIDPKMNKT
jgi:hypothetical protein